MISSSLNKIDFWCRNIGEGKVSEQQRHLSEKDIANVIKGIKFGSVEITIHDGKVVQVERKEKIRAIDSKESESVSR